MLLRCSFPVFVFIGALVLAGWALALVKNHPGHTDETVAPYHGPLSGMLHLMPERQLTARQRIAGNAASAGSGSEVRRTPSRDDGAAPPTPGYFERARMLLYLLRLRHWRKSAQHETPQAEHET